MKVTVKSGRQFVADVASTWDQGGLRGRILVAGLALSLAAVITAVATFSFGFAAGGPTSPLPGLPVPSDQVQAIKTAALSCPTLTAPRLAAQLMAASGFNPQASTGGGGGSGIAGLTEVAWKQWAPAPDSVRIDASANIIALAHEVCDLVGRVRAAGVPGDPWRLALAAFHDGLEAVQAAGGTPADAVGYVDVVSAYAAYYEQLPEFRDTGPTTPGPSTIPGPSGTPATSPPSTSVATPIPSANSWRLTWSDEFNGTAGTAPDTSKWDPEVGGDGWGNAELQYDTPGTSNAALDGSGHLIVTARDGASGLSCWYGPCAYTSARLSTAQHFTQAYGRVSARIKLPKGQGIWASFVAFGNNITSVGWPQSGAIVIMNNYGNNPTQVHADLIGPAHSAPAVDTSTAGTFADDYHTFTADWYPDHVAFSVDDRLYSTADRAAFGSSWVFDHPFFLVLKLAVGGNQPGNPDASTQFPQQMLVDWVRVYQSGPPA